jgi:hypothetical protein
MVQLANQTAAQINSNANIRWVTVGKPSSLFDSNIDLKTTALEITFYFYSPDNHGIKIAALDTDPPRIETIKRTDNFSSFIFNPNRPESVPETVAGLPDKLAYVSMGPRELFASTQEQAASYINGSPVTVEPAMNLLLDQDWQKRYGIPAGWNMVYDYPAAKPSSAKNSYLILHIDGSTGNVAARETSTDYPYWELIEP